MMETGPLLQLPKRREEGVTPLLLLNFDNSAFLEFGAPRYLVPSDICYKRVGK